MYGRAEPLLVGSFGTLAITRGERYPDTIDVLRKMFTLRDAWGKPDEAAKYRAMLPPEDGSKSAQGDIGDTPQ